MGKRKFDFNQGITELEEIVTRMEGDELSLDEALNHYERGVLLIRKCQQVLNEAEQKILLLSKEDNYQEKTPYPNADD